MKLITALFALSATASFALEGKLIDAPYEAPATEGVDQNGAAVKFADLYKANEFVVVYFYPKADTPGCTKQGCSLRDAHADLTAAGVKVIGVSKDTPAAQKGFAEKFSFPFTLIADNDTKVIEAFKVAKRPNGMASRECFLVQKGKVIWHDNTAATEKQADDLRAVLAQVKK